jgi:5-methylcytosine-specific restriction endonuclease McrA
VKKCSKCGEIKPLDEFNKRKSSKDGKRSQCRKCEHGYKKRWDIANADTVKEYSKAYYAANAETRRVYSRGYYAANADRVAESNRTRANAYYIEHAEARKSYQREYRFANPEAVKARILEWRKKKPERKRASDQRRRALKRGASTEDFTYADIIQYWLENNINPDRCIYCPPDLPAPFEHFDHVIPLSRGGTHERANLVPACVRCNLSKGAKLLNEWRPDITDRIGVSK